LKKYKDSSSLDNFKVDLDKTFRLHKKWIVISQQKALLNSFYVNLDESKNDNVPSKESTITTDNLTQQGNLLFV